MNINEPIWGGSTNQMPWDIHLLGLSRWNSLWPRLPNQQESSPRSHWTYVCVCVFVCVYYKLHVQLSCATIIWKRWWRKPLFEKNSLKQRFQGHFYQIAHDAEKTEVSRHFNGNGHQGIKDVGIHILDFFHQTITKSSTTDIRLGLEFEWIHHLHCLIPKGLNSLDSSY